MTDTAEDRRRAKLKHWGAPVPEHLRHGTNTRASQVYGCDCSACLPSGRRRRVREDRVLTAAERQRRSRQNLRGTPVPEHVRHGAYAYRVYAHRCSVCVAGKMAEETRRRNRWRVKARGVWTTDGDNDILCWPPRDAGPDWRCTCGGSRP